ncbi:MAG: HDOD domain-containing protein [Planctomycetota bacterium]
MNEDLIEDILSSGTLPSLPAIATRVLELVGDENVKMDELAETVEKDPALAGKILRTVNSSFYGLRQPCSSIRKALVMLGLGPVKTLVLGFSLVTSVEGGLDEPFDYMAFWRRSLFGAVGAKAVADHLRLECADQAFLGGLFQDIGVVASYKALGQRYIDVLALARGDHAQLIKHELEQLEIGHPQVGALLAQKWRLPEELILPVKYHERPSAAPGSQVEVVRLVALGNTIHDALSSEDATSAMRRYYTRAKEWFRIENADADEIFKRAADLTGEMKGLFNIDTGQAVDADAVLTQANKRMFEIAKSEPRESFSAAQLAEQNPGQAASDPLTGAVSREGYEQAIRAVFDAATRGELDLTVIHVAVQARAASAVSEVARDEVSIGVVALLTKHFEPLGGVVCRLAPSMYAVVLPGVGRAGGARQAEEFRADLPVTIAGWVDLEASPGLQVRSTIGIATLDRTTGEHIDSVERLVAASTVATRAALQAGGDRVRVFVPEAKAA